MVRDCPGCQQRELLVWYAAGTLSGGEATLVETALENCPNCREAFGFDQLLAQSSRTARAGELPPEELLRLAESPQADLSHLLPSDREIVGVLRAVAKEEEARSTSWLEKLRRLGERGWAAAGLGALQARPAWAYLLVLLLAYPAYRGVFGPMSEPGPRVLSAPVALGEPARAGETPEAGVIRSGADTVVTVFVPVDPSFRYDLIIEGESGREVFEVRDARPFDGIGTFAVLLPAGALSSGRYEVRVEEIEEEGSPRVVNAYGFTFSME